MTIDGSAREAAERHWHEANEVYVNAAVRRIRLLLHRRVLWLRHLWKHDQLRTYQDAVISDDLVDSLLVEKDRGSEKHFFEGQPEAVRLSRVLGEVEQALDATGANTPSLEILARLFHLSSFDRSVLALCLAPEVDPSFERLYAYVQDDATRRYPTPHLALALFGDLARGRAAAWRSFHPEAPLRRFRLVTLEGAAGSPAAPFGAEPLRLDRRIADYILGLNHMDAQAASLTRPVETTSPLTHPQEDLVGRLEHLLKSWDSQGRMPAFNLVGQTGVGRRALARALCDRLGVGLYAIDLTKLPPPGRERQDMWRLLEREAMLLPTAYYLDLSDVDPESRSDISLAAELAAELRAFLFVASRDRWRGPKPLMVIPVPKADPAAQRALWRAVLADGAGALNEALGPIIHQFDFGPEAIQQAAGAAHDLARLRNPNAPRLTVEDCWRACQDQAANPLRDLAKLLIPCYTWDDIVLPEDTLHQLHELAAQAAHRAHVYEAWGFAAKLSRGQGINALFAGPSGAGKTMAAEVIAHYLKLDLYRIDLSGVISKYIGESEKNLRRVFDATEKSGVILFFDEADALFGKRSEVRDSHDRYANIEINYLLQRMEDYRGLAILATNMKTLLDQAFLRRLRFLIDFPFPDAAHRLRIWQRVFPREASVEGLDYTFLSRLEIAGGNIRNIALNAAFLAAEEGCPIQMHHVLHATRREYVKIDKLMSESEFGPYYAVARQSVMRR